MRVLIRAFKNCRVLYIRLLGVASRLLGILVIVIFVVVVVLVVVDVGIIGSIFTL